MKRLLFFIALAACVSGMSAQQTIRDLFREMPDSLMPYLSQNNRLDFIDFLDSNMKAEVKNQFGGTSEMTALTDDSLSIRMNSALRVDMLLEPLQEPMDTVSQVIVFVETFLVDSLYGESSVRYFTPDWKLLSQTPPMTAVTRKRLKALKFENILKWDSDVLNKR